jgi:hypothetical protein
MLTPIRGSPVSSSKTTPCSCWAKLAVLMHNNMNIKNFMVEISAAY